MKAIATSVPFRVLLLVLLIAGAVFGLERLSDAYRQTDTIAHPYKDLRFHIDDGPLAADGGDERPPDTSEWVPAPAFKGGARYWASLQLPDPLPRDPVLTVKTNADYFAVYIGGERIYREGELGRRAWTGSSELHTVSLGGRQGEEVVVRLYSQFGQSSIEEVQTGSRAQVIRNMLVRSLFLEAVLIGLFACVAVTSALWWRQRRRDRAGLTTALVALCLVPQAMLQEDAALAYLLWENRQTLTYAGAVLLHAAVLLFLTGIGALLDENRRSGIRLAAAGYAVPAALHAAALIYDDALAAVAELLAVASGLLLGCALGYLLVRRHRNEPTRSSAILLSGVLTFTIVAVLDVLAETGVFDTAARVPVLGEMLQGRHALWGALVLVLSYGWSAAVRVTDERSRYWRELETSYAQLAGTSEAYGRFVPHRLLGRLHPSGAADAEPGDHVSRRMTVLWAEIRSFAPLSERLAPEETLRVFNDYLGEMEALIAYRGGFHAGCRGSGILAVFDGEPDGAVDAAVSMLLELDGFNEKRRTLGLPTVETGIGIHTGELILGVLGGQDRLEGAVIGGAVDTAVAAERQAAALGVRLLVTGETVRSLAEPDRHGLRAVDTMPDEDGHGPLTIYEVLHAERPEAAEPKRAVDALLQEGRARMERREYHQAMRVWEACLRTAPDDPVVRVWRERCRQALRLDPVR